MEGGVPDSRRLGGERTDFGATVGALSLTLALVSKKAIWPERASLRQVQGVSGQGKALQAFTAFIQ